MTGVEYIKLDGRKVFTKEGSEAVHKNHDKLILLTKKKESLSAAKLTGSTFMFFLMLSNAFV